MIIHLVQRLQNFGLLILSCREAWNRGGNGPSGRAASWCGDFRSPRQPKFIKRHNAPTFQRFIPILFAATIIMAGCTVGPTFKKTAAPSQTRYTPAPLPAQTVATTNVMGGDSQRFVEGMDIPGQWWTLFHSKPLDDLIQRALTNSPDLAAAQAALAGAHENLLAQNGAYYPSANASFSATRQRTSHEIAPVPNANQFNFSLFTPEVSVAYSPDVFGLNRRTVELLKAQENGARFALAAAHVTLSANIVVAAVQEASLRAQINASLRIIAINENILQVQRSQYAKGAVTRAALAAQESQLAQSEAALPPLKNQLAQVRDQLAALSGGFPGDGLPETFDLAALQLPRDLPVTLPSQLVAQRPDIRQAEENLHSASALIGVAIAHRIPNITLTANAGTMALTAGEIFSGGAGMWDIGAGITQPIFEGGALLHQERAARDACAQAAAQYRSTVITAFQNVADTLNALQHDAETLQSAATAANAARISLDLTRRQLEVGGAGYLDVLNAEQTYQQANIALIQARANRYSDTAALFQALGGGWWNAGPAQPF
ncbi:MAG TPA: efflux transporter outer membrane subunit [Verrucomicrobiae bacterium]|nr:efflux transporter outer membrane subunit [Verrucomicrobiae bacterium]